MKLWDSSDEEEENPKFGLLSRNPYEYERDSVYNFHKINTSYGQPKPFAEEREYVAAMNATKIGQILARPFVRALETRSEITAMNLDTDIVTSACFGTSTGEIEVWNFGQNKKLASLKCHEGVVKGLCYYNSKMLISCGMDKMVHRWDMSKLSDSNIWSDTTAPIHTMPLTSVPDSLDSQKPEDQDQYYIIGTTDSLLLLNYDSHSNEPYHTYNRNTSYNYVKFHTTNSNYFAGLTKNNKIHYFDIREKRHIHELSLVHRMNAIDFNPKSPFEFTVASDDYNLYSFDLRKMHKPFIQHVGHTNSVIDVSYSANGKEFVSASTDRSIRIYKKNGKMSREIYTSKRMHALTGVRFTLDSKFVLSASRDNNVRVWKAVAHEKLGPMTHQELNKLNEANALRQKYANHDEIKKIATRRNIPTTIKHFTKEHRVIQQKQNRKQRNEIRYEAAKGVKKQFKTGRDLAMRDDGE